MTKDIALRLASIGLVAVLCVLWWAGSEIGLFHRAFVPNPLDVWTAAVDGLQNGNLVAQTGGTLLRMAQGWLAAATCGIAIGACIGMSATARAYFQPSLEFLRPLPASAIIPVAIALFGLIVIAFLLYRRVAGAIILGIAAATVVAVVVGLATLPAGAWVGMPRFDTMFQADVAGALSLQLLPLLLSLVMVDFFDTIGTVTAEPVNREAFPNLAPAETPVNGPA